MWRLRWRLIELSVSSQSGLFDQYPVASIMIYSNDNNDDDDNNNNNNNNNDNNNNYNYNYHYDYKILTKT